MNTPNTITEHFAAEYYMVHCADMDPTNMAYSDEEEAKHEAMRLATKEPGKIFFVLKTITAFSVKAPAPTEVKLVPAPTF